PEVRCSHRLLPLPWAVAREFVSRLPKSFRPPGCPRMTHLKLPTTLPAARRLTAPSRCCPVHVDVPFGSGGPRVPGGDDRSGGPELRGGGRIEHAADALCQRLRLDTRGGHRVPDELGRRDLRAREHRCAPRHGLQRGEAATL